MRGELEGSRGDRAIVFRLGHRGYTTMRDLTVARAVRRAFLPLKAPWPGWWRRRCGRGLRHLPVATRGLNRRHGQACTRWQRNGHLDGRVDAAVLRELNAIARQLDVVSQQLTAALDRFRIHAPHTTTP